VQKMDTIEDKAWHIVLQHRKDKVT